jgi:SPP1 gp7 family putative phage head morphogenesis protein
VVPISVVAMKALRSVDGRPGVTVPFPEKIAASLAAQYGALNTRAMELVNRYLVPAIASGSEPRIKSAIGQIERTLASEYSDKKVGAMAQTAGKAANGYHSKLFYGALGIAIGAKLLAPGKEALVRGEKPSKTSPVLAPARRGAPIMVQVQTDPAIWGADFVAENVKLIGDLRRGIVPGLNDAVIRAVERDRNEDPQALAEKLRAMWAKNGVPSTLKTESGRELSAHAHALLVAEDQINKLNARLSMERQLDAGIESFRWRTKGDGRVRRRHKDLEGTVWTWESGGPSGVGLPGTPVRCRCSAEAVIDKATVLAALTVRVTQVG